MTAPKLFISYSWSNPEHEQWVLDLATQLRQSGVDAKLDKWDLREGHDAIAFMEQMVTDPEINKVLMVCDETYAEKADGRSGGVGTETQIISREVYEKRDQDKFVAVIAKRDPDGRAYLPTYYKSRIYIDLSETDRFAENFEQLLRWIFDKPVHIKPELGNPPSFLTDSQHVSLGTTAAFNRCIDAIRNSKPYAPGAFDEYCNTFSSNLERFRLSNPDGEFDDAVIKSINEFLPYRNEAIQLFFTIAQYAPTLEFTQRIHRLFESLIPYMDRPVGVSQWREWDFDNFRFIIHELFLYTLAIFLKYERFDQVNLMLQQQYYLPANAEGGRDELVSFIELRRPMESLEHREQRLRLSRSRTRAKLLQERCVGTGLEFRHLMQADFVAFMRAEIEADGHWIKWWPDTLCFLATFNSPFEIFARSNSKSYFDSAKVLLTIENPKDLEPLLTSYRDRSRKLPSFGYAIFNPAILLGYDQLATRP